MNDNPILEAIRSLLKFKDSTSISEIASIAGLPRKRVLDVINTNGTMVWRDRRTGKITRVDPRGVLDGKLSEAGAYFWLSKGNYGSVDTIEFKKHDDLRIKLQEEQWWGGFGDSYKATCVVDTPEHRSALVEDGCILHSDVILDDRLWKE